jgi:hypothetical protein
MIVTAHQPNFLPGISIIEKIEASDAVIWLDEVQYSHGGWSNRNKMPDGSWLTVPVDRDTDMQQFNRVKISEHGNWRDKAVKTLEQHFGDSADFVANEIKRPYGLLVGLNLAILRYVTDSGKWHFQSHLDGGRAVIAVSDEMYELLPISNRLAMMVSELGGTVYLSGPSGYRYLSEKPFADLGIEVRYWKWNKPNPCSLGLVQVFA